jgi:2-alkenal reductase
MGYSKMGSGVVRMKSSVIVLGILILAFYALISTSTMVATTNASLPGQVISDTSMDDTLAYIFDRVSSSIVQVVSITPPLFNLNPQVQNTTEVGAGFIYDDAGHIVTANHVLAGANNVLKIEDNNNTAVPDTIRPSGPVTLGNSSALRIGDHVVTIGYPFASKIAMTAGIIGQTDYLLYFPFLGYSVPNTILTDVAVNPGNSGGPLINMRGEVVGMIYGRLNPTATSAGTLFPGLSVAIPSNTISRVADGLIQDGLYIHPAVGIIGTTLTVDLAKQFNDIPDDLEGVLVDTVVRGGTADIAGIDAATTNKYGERQSGDVITALDGNSIVDIEGLLSYVQENKTIGENIAFTVYRNGEYLSLNAPLQPIK